MVKNRFGNRPLDYRNPKIMLNRVTRSSQAMEGNANSFTQSIILPIVSVIHIRSRRGFSKVCRCIRPTVSIIHVRPERFEELAVTSTQPYICNSCSVRGRVRKACRSIGPGASESLPSHPSIVSVIHVRSGDIGKFTVSSAQPYL